MSSVKSSQFKIAFTGTNCSGKTTMAMDVTARLKYQHVLAELVSSQDRKITWRDEHFPIDTRAHYGMISNLVNAEVQAELKGDATVVVTDRSVLDLFAIMLTDHPDHPNTRGMEHYVKSWLSTYTCIYYLEPLKYQEDGKRPSDDFRMKTHATLRRLIDEYQLSNLKMIPRDAIYKDIQSILGVLPKKSILDEDEKWQAVAKTIGCRVFVKTRNSEISSDIDAWVLTDEADYSLIERANHAAAFYFGTSANIKFMAHPNTNVSLEGKYFGSKA